MAVEPEPRKFPIPPTTQHCRGETWQTIIKYGLDHDYQLEVDGQILIGNKERLLEIFEENRGIGKKI